MTMIYIDIDDVLAEWRGQAERLLGHEISKDPAHHLPSKEWQRIKNEVRFYRTLPLMPNARDLIAWLQRYERRHANVQLGFLTALPHDNDMPWAYYDKVMWCQDYFPSIPVFFGPQAADKYKHCTFGDILIDDRESNILDWERAGGIGHLYTTWENCEKWLEETLNVSYRAVEAWE